jgi:hypothetical protein
MSFLLLSLHVLLSNTLFLCISLKCIHYDDDDDDYYYYYYYYYYYLFVV